MRSRVMAAAGAALVVALTAPVSADASLVRVSPRPAGSTVEVYGEGSEANHIVVSEPPQAYTPAASVGAMLVDDTGATLRANDARCQHAAEGFACLAAAGPLAGMDFYVVLGAGDDVLESPVKPPVRTALATVKTAPCLSLTCNTLLDVDGGPGNDVIHLNNSRASDFAFCGDGQDTVYVDYADGPIDGWFGDCERVLFVHVPGYHEVD